MILGLIPDCLLEHTGSAGNAAGTGARLALLNGALRKELEREVRRIEKIETAVEPKFQEHFVDAMAIPHKTADYPCLERVVSLPRRKAAMEETGTGRPRRRRRART